MLTRGENRAGTGRGTDWGGRVMTDLLQAASRPRSARACTRARRSNAGSRRGRHARTTRGGRLRPEEESELRTPFQRDRDRILHSKAFRRLKGKTQVFIDPSRRPLPHADHAHARDDRDLARRRSGAPAQRGSRRGDRPRARHRAPAVRPRRRGGARRGAARALRAALPPQRAVAPDRRIAQPDRGGPRRHPHAHRRGRAGDARGEDRPIVDRVAYINHDIDDAIRFGLLDEDDLPRAEIALLGPTGSTRIDRLVHDLVETSEGAATSSRSTEVGEAMLALRAFMFERVYLGPHARRARARASRRAARSSRTSSSAATTPTPSSPSSRG